jgi:hypothetical protein
MSYDLRVATHTQPDAGLIEDIARERGASIEGDDPLVVRRARSGFTIDVGRAVRCEIDDLDDELATAVLAPRWLTEISLAYDAPKADVTLARALARGLAEACDGAALDPQEDGLLWPRRRAPRYRPPATEKRIPILNVSWILTSWDADDLPRRWLSLASRHVPEAAPVRYGDFEPLQERMEQGGEERFVQFWREHVAADVSLGMFWSSRRPFYGGAFSAPHPSKHERDAPGLLAAKLSTELDARALDEAPWRETVADLFKHVADELDAVYAAGWIERGVLASARGLAYDDKSDSFSDFTPLRGRWLGVPPVPAWLSWFGAPYRDKLAGVGEAIGAGILVRAGELPQADPGLERDFPQLPPEILAAPGREAAATWLPSP